MTMSGLAAVRGLAILVDVLARGTALLALGLLVAGLLKGRSAALRHFVLSVFIIGLLFLPVLSLLPSSYGLRLLPSWLAVTDSSRGALDESASKRDLARERRLSADGTSVSAPRELPGSDLSDRHPAGVIGPGTARRPAGIPRFAGYAGFAAACLWLAGLAYLLARLAAGLAGARRLSRQGTLVDDASWRAIMRRFLESIPLARPVRLKRHDEVALPLTWGVIRPTVIVPAASDAWSDEERSSALFHELSHVKRFDFLVLMLVRLSLAVQWLNPLARPAFRRLKGEQEKACDELVLKAGIKPSIYAANLLSLKQAASASWSPSAALLGMMEGAAVSPFKERLAAILGKNLFAKEFRVRTRLALTLSVICLVALIGLARPSARPAGAQTAASSAAAAQDVEKPRPAQVPKPVPQAVPVGAAAAPAAPKPAGAAPSTPAPIGPVPAANPAPVPGPAPAELAAAPAPSAKPGEPVAPVEAAAEDQEQASKMKDIVVTPARGAEEKLALLISDGEEKRVLRPGHAVTLKLDAAGKNIIVTPDGGGIAMKPGKDVRIVVEGGTISFARKERGVVIGKDAFLNLREDDSGNDVIAAYRVPGFSIKEAGASDEFAIKDDAFEALALRLKVKEAVGKKIGESEAALAASQDLQKEMQALKAKLAELAKHQADLEMTRAATGEALGNVQDETARAKAAGLAEQLAKETQENIAAQEKAIKHSIEDAVRAREALKASREIEVAIAEKQAEAIKERLRAEMDMAKDREFDRRAAGEERAAEGMPYAVVTGDGGFTIYWHAGPGAAGKAAIEKAVSRMKGTLPEGYGLDVRPGREAGVVAIVVKPAKPGADGGALLDKMFRILKEEAR